MHPSKMVILSSIFNLTSSLFDGIDLEWRMIYVGAAESSEFDQVLDSIMVGPVPVGVNKFIFAVSWLFTLCFRYSHYFARPMHLILSYYPKKTYWK